MYWLLVGGTLIAFAYLYIIKPLLYWKHSGVPQNSVIEIWKEFFLMAISNKGVAQLTQNAYNCFAGKRCGGVYQFYTPVLLLRDPVLIQQITIKNFDHFTDNINFPQNNEDIWQKNLFVLKGNKWRNMRATLSPSYTKSKMTIIYPLIIECVKQLVIYLENEIKDEKSVEMKEIFSKVTTDVIASSAFGIPCNSFENSKNEFFLTGRAITNFQSFFSNIRIMLLFAFPRFSKLLNLKFSNPKYVSFFKNVISENIKSRRKHGIVRADMLHLLLEAKRKIVTDDLMDEVENEGFAVISDKSCQEESGNKCEISDEDIIAQSFIFFFAGSETISDITSFMAYELAVNPEIQEKLYQEILNHEINNFGESPEYENLSKLKYLDMVVSETLRKYPTTTVLNRACTKPYTIQPETEGEIPIKLKVGDVVRIPIIGIHRDPQFYPDPDRFDPERFSDDNKYNIISGTYLPFGSGPRHCIGHRFALIEIKLVFYYLLSKFKLVVIDKTQIPLKMANSQISMVAKNGYWMKLQKRKDKQNKNY